MGHGYAAWAASDAWCPEDIPAWNINTNSGFTSAYPISTTCSEST